MTKEDTSQGTVSIIIFELVLTAINFMLINNILYVYYNKIKFLEIEKNIGVHFESEIFFLSIVLSLVLTTLIMLFFSFKKNEKKRGYKEIEHGSARWAEKNEINKFMNDDFFNNIIFTQTERLNLSFKAKTISASRNKNALVIGGSGTGKTRFFVKPNLMQLQGSYVVTDPKGDLIKDTGTMFVDKGYDVLSFNLVNTFLSMKYNPFFYIENESDILIFVNVLMENTKGSNESSSSNSDFFNKAEQMYYTAIIAYMLEKDYEENHNIETFLKYISMGSVDDGSNKLKTMFDELEKEDKNSFAVSQYRNFEKGAGDTLRSILISCAVRMTPFYANEIKRILMGNDIDLYNLAPKKTILYIITSDTNKTFNFIGAIMYSQLINILVKKADQLDNSRFKEPVQLIFDEFYNIGVVPNFENTISVLRSRNISAIVILQSLSQLKNMYDKASDIIMDCCESYLFLGAKGETTVDNMVKNLGTTTITYNTESDSLGNQKSKSINQTKTSRNLMNFDEILSMDNTKCIYQLRGVRPFFSDKFKLESHPRYKLLADYEPKRKFDIEDYLKNKEINKKQIEIEEYDNIYLYKINE